MAKKPEVTASRFERLVKWTVPNGEVPDGDYWWQLK